MPNRIDPKTRRLIISDLTPPHKDKTTGVHGVGEVSSKEAFDDYKGEQEEKSFITDRVIKSILFSLWQGVDWSEVDLWDIDWEEWIEPVVLESEYNKYTASISAIQDDNRVIMFMGL